MITPKGVMSHTRSSIRTICFIALVGFIWYTLNSTVFGRETYSEYKYKEFPFWSYLAIYDGKTVLIKEDLLNVALFLPIGFLLFFSITRKSWRIATLSGLGLSVCIELMQLIGKRGTCEFDDVFHNTIGCVIGYYVAWAVMMLYNRVKHV